MPRTKGARNKKTGDFELWRQAQGDFRDLKSGTPEYRKSHGLWEKAKKDKENKDKENEQARDLTPPTERGWVTRLNAASKKDPRFLKRATTQTLDKFVVSGSTAAPGSDSTHAIVIDTEPGSDSTNPIEVDAAPPAKKHKPVTPSPPSQTNKGHRKSKYKSEHKNCHCGGGAKVFRKDRRLFYTCTHAKVNSAQFGGGLGGVKCCYNLGRIPNELIQIEVKKVLQERSK